MNKRSIHHPRTAILGSIPRASQRAEGVAVWIAGSGPAMTLGKNGLREPALPSVLTRIHPCNQREGGADLVGHGFDLRTFCIRHPGQAPAPAVGMASALARARDPGSRTRQGVWHPVMDSGFRRNDGLVDGSGFDGTTWEVAR